MTQFRASLAGAALLLATGVLAAPAGAQSMDGGGQSTGVGQGLGSALPGYVYYFGYPSYSPGYTSSYNPYIRYFPDPYYASNYNPWFFGGTRNLVGVPDAFFQGPRLRTNAFGSVPTLGINVPAGYSRVSVSAPNYTPNRRSQVGAIERSQRDAQPILIEGKVIGIGSAWITVRTGSGKDVRADRYLPDQVTPADDERDSIASDKSTLNTVRVGDRVFVPLPARPKEKLSPMNSAPNSSESTRGR